VAVGMEMVGVFSSVFVGANVWVDSAVASGI
jgi:hypothetical protein